MGLGLFILIKELVCLYVCIFAIGGKTMGVRKTKRPFHVKFPEDENMLLFISLSLSRKCKKREISSKFYI